ncbi:MAG: FkbM family methyltransferase [Verrucomicrobiales bacterium]
MPQVLHALAVKSLGVVEAFPTGLTDGGDLRRLLRSLRPRQPSQDLIRLGPADDGGYLVPDDLAGIDACFSPGVSSVSGFEKDCADRGMPVFLADRSVEGPAESHPRFHFTKKFVGATTNEAFMTLDDWVNTSMPGSQSDLLLQMDIEGFEYEVILAASDALMRRFRIIVAEFHQIDQLWSRPIFRLAGRAIEKLLQTHACVHIHPNNCCGSLRQRGLDIPRVMEFTFVRHDRLARDPGYRTVFPHPLDCDNTSNPPLPLPECWYREA